MSKRRLTPLGASLLIAGATAVAIVIARRSDASIPAPPRVLTASAPRAARAPLRVLVYHDMEGLAGQDDWQSFLFSHPEKYPAGQKLLAADLNAVIAGLFSGGATQVD